MMYLSSHKYNHIIVSMSEVAWSEDEESEAIQHWIIIME